MKSEATTTTAYLKELPEERKKPMEQLRKAIKSSLPKGFEETMQYGMITYVVPHKLYPAGYHCKPTDALPFISIASQKNFIAVYHMGLYSNPALLKWFEDAYVKAGIGKLDMGKSCIRFKKPENIPFALIAELCTKVTVEQWIEWYEKAYKKS